MQSAQLKFIHCFGFFGYTGSWLKLMSWCTFQFFFSEESFSEHLLLVYVMSQWFLLKIAEILVFVFTAEKERLKFCWSRLTLLGFFLANILASSFLSIAEWRKTQIKETLFFMACSLNILRYFYSILVRWYRSSMF